jgi:predicted peroxiredoxin
VSGLLIVASAGPQDPSRSCIPLHIAANGATPGGVDSAIAFAGDAVNLLKPEVIAELKGLGIPPLSELMQKCVAQNLRFYVCKGCAEARGVTAEMLGPNASMIMPPDLVRLTMEADRVLSF